MKYLVTWKVDKQIPAPCPDRKVDLYTGEMSMISCAVYHFENITEKNRPSLKQNGKHKVL